jgi:DNA primase
VADLPPGRDPGDLWKEDQAALSTAIERAAPFLQFRLDRLLAAADLRTLEGRARAAEAAAAIVASHPNELVRDQYVMKVAGTLEIDADRLREVVRSGPERRPARTSGPARDDEERPRPRPATVDRRELDVLRWAIHRPELVADWLDASLFVDPSARSVFELLTETATFHEAIDASDGPTRALLQRLAVEEPEVVDDADELATLQARLMANTVEPAAQRVLDAMLRESDERGSEVKTLLSAMTHHRAIGDWEAARRDAEQLVSWTVARTESVQGAE